MSNITLPDNLDSELWAGTGTKTDPGSAKYGTGWVREIPSPEDENFIQNRQDAAIAHIVENGIAQWNNTITYNKGALCSFSGIVLTSRTASNINNSPSDAISPGTVSTSWARLDSYVDLNTQTFADSSLRYCNADANSVVLNKDFSNVGTATSTTKAKLGTELATTNGTAGSLVGYNSNGSIELNQAATGATAADSVVVGVGNTNQELRTVTLATLKTLLDIRPKVPTYVSTGGDQLFKVTATTTNRTPADVPIVLEGTVLEGCHSIIAVAYTFHTVNGGSVDTGIIDDATGDQLLVIYDNSPSQVQRVIQTNFVMPVGSVSTRAVVSPRAAQESHIYISGGYKYV